MILRHLLESSLPVPGEDYADLLHLVKNLKTVSHAFMDGDLDDALRLTLRRLRSQCLMPLLRSRDALYEEVSEMMQANGSAKSARLIVVQMFRIGDEIQAGRYTTYSWQTYWAAFQRNKPLWDRRQLLREVMDELKALAMHVRRCVFLLEPEARVSDP